MLRRWLSVPLAAAILFGAAACGEKTETGAADKLQNALGGQAGSSAAANTASAAPAAGAKTLETEFWTLAYSEDWAFSEEEDLEVSEGYRATALLRLPKQGNAEETALLVEISAEVESPDDYRDFLRSIGDMKEIVEGGAAQTETMGGVACYYKEGESWGEAYRRWEGRVENAGATVYVNASGDVEDARLQELLAGLTFTLKDQGKQDPPWPWNGEPILNAGPFTNMIGSVTVESGQLRLDPSVVVQDIFDAQAVAADENIYILSDSILRQYALQDDRMVFEKELPLDGDGYDTLCASDDGTVFVSGFMEDFVAFKNGEKIFAHDGPDSVAVAPSGTWGISWFTGPELEKDIFEGGTLKTETWDVSAELKNVSAVNIGRNYIMVAGSAADNERHAIFVYDHAGNLQFKLGGTESEEPDSLGSVTATVETDNGFMALDGNMREVMFWAKDGSFIGGAEDGDLFKTSYPWMSSAQRLSDGSILVGMTEERDDESADEFILYLVKGF